MYDVVIIGAGPAGSTLARMLDRKLKVLVIDKRNLNDDTMFIKEKCCGGLLAPDAQKMLARLGLGVPKDILTGPQMFSVKSIDFDNKLIRFYQRHYINVNREKFDRWLVSMIPNSVEKRFNVIFKSYKEVDENIEVKLYSEKGDYTIKTKILVGADGAISRVRSQAFENSIIPDKYVSIQEWYKTNQVMPYYTSIFDKNITDFYSWTIQKGKYIIVGSAIPIFEDVNKRFSLLVRKLKKNGYINGKAVKREGTMIMRTRSNEQINVVNNNIVLIGEAAGFISPSSAEGISYGLKSGSILASCINKYGNNFGVNYERKIKKIKFNLFIKNLKSMIMYNKYLRRIIMKLRILSIKVKG